jgi:hypothetical protein
MNESITNPFVYQMCTVSAFYGLYPTPSGKLVSLT